MSIGVRQWWLVAGMVLVSWCHLVSARPPVRSNQGQVPQHPATNESSDWELNIEYNRYLQEVVQVLESDPEFREKLKNADAEKIRDGTIAQELEMARHHVRNQLDDIKRRELDRLRQLSIKQYEMNNHIDKKHAKIPQHIQLKTPTFEVEDLRRLILSTTKDLQEADDRRRQAFKRYEMEKKFEKEQRLSHIDDLNRRQEEEQRLREMESRHRQHDRLKHPMTKDQLVEVWEQQDHMRSQDWDPKTFFAMHDLNGDGFWDEDEVKMLFKKELDRVYDPNAPEDDMREREEEMERMREHVFKESDTDKDRLISFSEFLEETKADKFYNDPGWETLDQDPSNPFTDEEFKAYEMQRMREIQGMINQGIVPEGYPYYGPPPVGAPLHPQFDLGRPPHQAPYQPQAYPPPPQQQHQQFRAQGQPVQQGLAGRAPDPGFQPVPVQQYQQAQPVPVQQHQQPQPVPVPQHQQAQPVPGQQQSSGNQQLLPVGSQGGSQELTAGTGQVAAEQHASGPL